MQQKDNVTITKHHAFLYKKNQFFNYGGLSSYIYYLLFQFRLPFWYLSFCRDGLSSSNLSTVKTEHSLEFF